jgi:hypothetical protein
MAALTSQQRATDGIARMYLTFFHVPCGHPNDCGSGAKLQEITFGPFQEVEVACDQVYVWGAAAGLLAAMAGEDFDDPDEPFTLANRVFEDHEWALDRKLSRAHQRFENLRVTTVVPEATELLLPAAPRPENI